MLTRNQNRRLKMCLFAIAISLFANIQHAPCKVSAPVNTNNASSLQNPKTIPGLVASIKLGSNRTGKSRSRIHSLFLREKSKHIFVGVGRDAKVYQFPSGKRSRTIPIRRGPFAVSTDGSTLICEHSSPAHLDLISTADAKLLRRLRLPLVSTFRYICCKNQVIAYGQGVKNIHLANINDGRSKKISDHAIITAIAMSGNERKLAVADSSGSIVIWNVKSLTVERELKLPASKRALSQRATSLSLSHTGDYLAAGTTNGAYVWDVAKGKTTLSIPAKQFGGHIRLSPDSRLVVVSEHQEGFALWDLPSKRFVLRVRTPSTASHFDFSQSGRFLCIGLKCRTVQIWDLAKLKMPAKINPVTFESNWKSLAKIDPKIAYSAMFSMLQTPKATIVKLRKRLIANPKNGEKSILRLIETIYGQNAKARQIARLKILKMGDAIKPILTRELSRLDNADRKRALASIIEQLDAVGVSASQLQQTRSIQIVQWIGGKGAIRLLAELSSGDESSMLTRQAKTALILLKR